MMHSEEQTKPRARTAISLRHLVSLMFLGIWAGCTNPGDSDDLEGVDEEGWFESDDATGREVHVIELNDDGSAKDTVVHVSAAEMRRLVEAKKAHARKAQSSADQVSVTRQAIMGASTGCGQSDTWIYSGANGTGAMACVRGVGTLDLGFWRQAVKSYWPGVDGGRFLDSQALGRCNGLAREYPALGPRVNANPTEQSSWYVQQGPAKVCPVVTQDMSVLGLRKIRLQGTGFTPSSFALISWRFGGSPETATYPVVDANGTFTVDLPQKPRCSGDAVGIYEAKDSTNWATVNILPPNAHAGLAVLGFVGNCTDSPTTFQLVGDTSCYFGQTDCNRCVNNVPSQFAALTSSYRAGGRVRFNGYAYPTGGYILNRIDGAYEHVQSIGRLPVREGDPYMLFTHSTASDEAHKDGAIALVRLGASTVSNGTAFGGMPHGDGADQVTQNRTVARTFSGNNHPGGLSLLGFHGFVAQWCQPHGNDEWCRTTTAGIHRLGFSVYRISTAGNNPANGNPPDELLYRDVNAESSKSTAGIAAVKLSNGKYLVALGRSGGQEYGFYLSSGDIDGNYVFLGTREIGFWGENASILTECGTGDLYMLNLEGYGSSNDVDKAHLYKLVMNGGLIDFSYVTSKTFTCRGDSVDGAGDWCHFDAGVGTYVDPNGKLILYATDWRQSDAGNIRFVEFD